MEFLCVKHQSAEGYVSIGRRVWSGHVHFIAGRSVPCVEQERSCPNCNPQTPKRWVGYLHVYTPNFKKDCFLTLPPGAGFQLLHGLGKDYNLRGRKVMCKREGRSHTAALAIWLDPQYAASFEMLPEKDPGKYLEEMFRGVLHLTEARNAS
jgi:hypothetical protein